MSLKAAKVLEKPLNNLNNMGFAHCQCHWMRPATNQGHKSEKTLLKGLMKIGQTVDRDDERVKKKRIFAWPMFAADRKGCGFTEMNLCFVRLDQKAFAAGSSLQRQGGCLMISLRAQAAGRMTVCFLEGVTGNRMEQTTCI